MLPRPTEAFFGLAFLPLLPPRLLAGLLFLPDELFLFVLPGDLFDLGDLGFAVFPGLSAFFGLGSLKGLLEGDLFPDFEFFRLGLLTELGLLLRP